MAKRSSAKLNKPSARSRKNAPHTKVTRSKSAMWGGRFSSGPAGIMQQLNASIDVDKQLYRQDIAGSIAHADMLAKQKLISKEEFQLIKQGLKEIEKTIESGQFTFTHALEDIHMHVESALIEKIGDAGRKLHTARSRNDQVATDFRLWVRDEMDAIDVLLQNLQRALLNRAEKHSSTIMPGFTHLQTAQPVTFGHHLMAYVEMFARDRSRFADARKRLNECPLGAAALAGTSLPIDRKHTAELLGFDRPMQNSMDAVSDRDFALEFLSAVSLTSIHLSRLSEELVLWMSDGFKFIQLSDAFTTGSSIMPQKKNPDAAELIRAKSGETIGSLVSLLIVMKGLPLAYSKDMQEDKKLTFESGASLRLSLEVMAGMIEDMKVNERRMRSASTRGYSTATDLADWLTRQLKLPFRKSHEVAGKIVALAEKKRAELHELPLNLMREIEPHINDDVYSVLTVENSVQSRKSEGGTSPDNVKKAIKAARALYLSPTQKPKKL